jgi:phenylalanyl-tRNA synthetase beta chain
MPPIINSDTVGKVTTKTKDVFIECSGFDFEYLSKSLNMIVTALAEIGGQIFEVKLNYQKPVKTPILEPTKKKLDIKYVNKILGENLSQKEIKTCLEKMGFGYEKNNVLIPCYRADILHQIDFVEDIAIAYGYENIKEEMPKIATIGQEDPFGVFENHVREILIGFGLVEVKNFHLSNPKTQNDKVLTNKELVQIENSFSEEYSVLRRMLTSQVLEVLQKNKHHEYPQNIFEIGKIFKPKTTIKENTRLCVALCGDANFTKIKQITESLITKLGITCKTVEVDDLKYPSFIPGRIAVIEVNNQNIAHIGEIHPQVLNNFELEMPVALLEIDLERIYKQT